MSSHKKKKIGRPIGFFYQLYILISAAIIRLGGVKINVDRSGVKDIKGPALLLCPHISLKDHILVGLTLLPKRPTFVLSEHFMTKPFLGKALKKLAHVITKKMFCTDASTIMNIMRAKNENNIIVLFPEGRLNAVAHSQHVAEGTAQLVKKLGVDVYTIAGNGSALVFPKWGEKRRGVINVTSGKLLSSEDIASMSVDQISAAIDACILHNDETACEGKVFKCKDTTKGLDGILYKCPECGDEYCLTSENGKIRCKSCGFETSLGEDYRFSSGSMRSVNEWFDWQIEELSLDTVLEDDVKIGTPGENGIMNFDAGFGHIKLTAQELTLTGQIFGEPIKFTKETSKIGGMPYTPMREFDLYYNKKLLYIMPPDGRRIIKYVTLVDKVYKRG